MNLQHDSTPNTAARKTPLPSSARALLVGLALVVACPAAMAQLRQEKPIPGIDVVVRKKPGGTATKAVTNKDGTYQFTGLAPGNYDITIPGQPPKSVTVGKDGMIRGQITGQGR